MATSSVLLLTFLAHAPACSAQFDVKSWFARMDHGKHAKAKKMHCENGDIGTRCLAAKPFTFTGLDTPAGEKRSQPDFADDIKIDGNLVGQTDYEIMLMEGEDWRSKNPYEGDTFGYIKSKTGKPVTNPRRTGTPGDTLWVGQSNNPDFVSLMYTGIPGKVHAIVHMENIPATTMLLELDQDQTTGKLTTKKATHMDWTKYGGLSSPCAGSLSPWNTHLGSEEWGPPNSRAEEDCTSCDCVHKYGKAFMAYHDQPDHTECTDYTEWRKVYNENYFTHYRYHYVWESGIDGVGTKHMAMGRRGIELPYAMPDSKTVYMSDDTEGGFLSVFKADTAEDLSAGTLWCAVFEQVADDSTVAGGSFTIKEWKDMGHATTADIYDAVMDPQPVKFYDMFETEAPADAAPWCSAGFTSINVGGLGHECLKVKPGKEKLASRLETRRYAAILGCTTETSKMEGITYSVETGKLYIGMTMIRRSMEDATHGNDKGGPNHIRVAKNDCGCVYELDVDPDTYLATTMKGLICGKLSDPADPDNKCDVNTIANPDNVASMHGHKMLLIAEDTTYHYNNILWLYDLEKRELVGRIGATPDLAEVCSPYFYPDVGGFSYITMVLQHPNLTSYGPSALGYVAWPRDCSVDYPAFSMPGHGSAARCATPATTPAPAPAPTAAPDPAPAPAPPPAPAPATTTAASDVSPAAEACLGSFAAALAILSFAA